MESYIRLDVSMHVGAGGVLHTYVHTHYVSTAVSAFEGHMRAEVLG